MEDNSQISDVKTETNEKKVWIRWRYVVAFLGFFGMVCSYTMQSHFSITLVAMVGSTDVATNSSSVECAITSRNSSVENQSINSGYFNWDAHMQGIAISGFYWGFLIPQILAGRLAELYGAKKVILVGGFIGTIGTLVGPWTAYVNVYFLTATRILCGLGMSVFSPSLHAIIAKWCPPNERSRLTAFVYSGNELGTVIAMPIAGALCRYAPNNGWPWPFYVIGIITAFWLVLWTVLFYDLPSTHPWISVEERNYIVSSLSTNVDDVKKRKLALPWKEVFTSIAFWSLLWTHFGHNWGYYTLLTHLPEYMSNVLGFEIRDNGLLSSVPYIAMVVVGNVLSFVADTLITRRWMSFGAVRKLFNSIALYSCGICLLVITFLKCETILVYALLVMAVGLDGGIYAGYQANFIDLSPNFAGTLKGITSMFATVPGIISPYVTAAFTAQGQTRANWSVVFYINSGILFFFGTQFLLFGSGNVQPWNVSKVNCMPTDDDEGNVDTSKNISEINVSKSQLVDGLKLATID